MGRMKEILMAIHDDGVNELDDLIKTAVRLNSDRITFRGRNYSIQDARQILIFMTDAERTIRRTEEFVERGPDSDN